MSTLDFVDAPAAAGWTRTRPLSYERVDSALLDCIDDNLAVLLGHTGVEDVRTPFACQWHFAFDPEGARPLRLARTPVEELIARHSGARIVTGTLDARPLAETCAAHAAAGTPLLLFGDAFLMPWLPYFAREHMEHSFIVDGASDDGLFVHVVDAYANRTAWGEAAPVQTELHVLGLERMVRDLESAHAGTWRTVERAEVESPWDVPALLRENAAAILRTVGEERQVERFSRHYAERAGDAEALGPFVLACWLAARARALHGLWLADVARERPHLLSEEIARRYAEEVAAPWQRASEFAYVMLRRVSQGKAAPDVCFRILEQTVAPGEVRCAQALQAAPGA